MQISGGLLLTRGEPRIDEAKNTEPERRDAVLNMHPRHRRIITREKGRQSTRRCYPVENSQS